MTQKPEVLKSAFPVTVENDEQKYKVGNYAKDNGLITYGDFFFKPNPGLAYPFVIKIMEDENRICWAYCKNCSEAISFTTFLERTKEGLFEVECVEAGVTGNLTNGGTYTVIGETLSEYLLQNDDRNDGKQHWAKSRFKRIESRKVTGYKHRASGKEFEDAGPRKEGQWLKESGGINTCFFVAYYMLQSDFEPIYAPTEPIPFPLGSKGRLFR